MLIMQIDIKKSRVMLTPENESEKVKLTALWKIMIDCVKDTRKLVPIGEYVPAKGNQGASFHIEGLEPQENSFVEVKATEDCQVYCNTCNKLLALEAGEVIPICCGKMMELVD
jgi:hypothetical protein